MEENIETIITEISTKTESVDLEDESSENFMKSDVELTTCETDNDNLPTSESSTEETCETSNKSDQMSLDCPNADSNQVLYSNLINDIVLLKEQNKVLHIDISRLEKENARLEADRSPELHAIQLETLEKTILQQRQEVERLQDSLRQQTEISKKHTLQLKQEYDAKLDRVSKPHVDILY